MPIINVVCKTTDDELDLCRVVMDTRGAAWKGEEPGGLSEVIKSKNGVVVAVTVPDLGAQCRSGSGSVALFLKNFNVSATKIGDAGVGHAYETGRPISWLVM